MGIFKELYDLVMLWKKVCTEVRLSDRQSLPDCVAEALHEEEQKGRAMLADSDYTDMFHPGGPHNVGQDTLDAVEALRGAVDVALAEPGLTIDDLLQRVADAKRVFAASHPDPDGFGLAVYSRLLDRLVAFAGERGETLRSPLDEAAGSAAFLVEAEMYARGNRDLLGRVVAVYHTLSPEEIAMLDTVLYRQLARDELLDLSVATQTIGLLREFYELVGRDEQLSNLLSHHMRIVTTALKERQQKTTVD